MKFASMLVAAVVVTPGAWVSGHGLVINGDFEAGNSGFQSGYSYTPLHDDRSSSYTITANPKTWNGYFPALGDQTSGTGMMFVADGAYLTPAWETDVPVTAGNTYRFTAWTASLYSSSPLLDFEVDGSSVGTHQTTRDAWSMFQADWTSPASGIVRLTIRSRTSALIGGDYALDDVHFTRVALPPSVIPLLSPTGTVIDTRRPVFTWAENAAAAWYHLWVSRNGKKYVSVWTQQASWVPPADMPEGRYTWWVQGWNPDGYGPWSARAELEVPLRVPKAPMLLGPSLSVATNRPTFEWGSVTYGAWYRLVVVRSDRPAFSTWLQSLTEYTLTEDERLAFGDYTFWVRAWGADGMGPWSTPMSFFFGHTHPLSPQGPVQGPRLEFLWIPVEGAAWYQIWLRAPGQAPVSRRVQGGSQWNPSMDFSAGAYTWYVRAGNLDGMGPWSEGMSFIVPASP